jgi:16S rRNA C1402 N4-methylase RsmH
MSKLSSSELVFNEVKTLLKEAAAEAVLQGIPMGDIVRAWSNYGDANQIKEAAAMVRDHLRERRILGSEQFAESLSKTASQGVVSNTQHPLVDNFLMFTKIAFEHAKLEEAVRMLGERLGDVRSTLRGML